VEENLTKGLKQKTLQYRYAVSYCRNARQHSPSATWIVARRLRKIAKQIVKMNDSIRKKYRVLKTDKIEENTALERHFESLVESLKQIVENTKKVGKKS